jgi:hypothetical protein
MKVLIVDDSINKFNDVSKAIINGRENFLEVYSVEDVKSAMDFIKQTKVDILIVDQQIPISSKISSDIEIDGGSKLIMEIERKRDQIIVPNYIVGLSQFPENQTVFSDIWKKLIYSPDKSDWSKSLNKLLLHVEATIGNSKDHIQVNFKKNYIYLEGLTDLNYLDKVLELNPDLVGDFELHSMSNAGANWVGQQLIIWGHTLPKTQTGEHLTSIGVFDNDDAGIKACSETKKKLSTQNQKQYAKIFSISPNFSNEVLEYYKNGLSIEIEIESLLPPNILKYAEEQNWLENRSTIFIKQPKEWDQMNETIPEFLERKGIKDDKLLYLKKVKIGRKRDLLNYVILEADKDSRILNNMKLMLEEIIKKLK